MEPRFTTPLSLLKFIVVIATLTLYGHFASAFSGDTGFTRNPYLVTVSAAQHSGKGKASTAKGGKQKARKGTFTAYTDRVKETDSTPHHTADQTNLKKTPQCVVANNSLPFGTEISVEGIGQCVVHDRASKDKAPNHFDIYMGSDVAKAKNFGKRELHYTIIGKE